MDSKIKSMKKADRKAVLFPHWFHRIRFKCKVCHERIFIMKKGANNISMSDIINREYCGRCHNGNIAFSPKECDRCHSYDKEKALRKRIVSRGGRTQSKKYSKFRKKYANKLAGTDKDGKRFLSVPVNEGETLEKKAFKGLDRDKFGLVNWAKAVRQGKIAPIAQLGDEIIEDKIILRKKVIHTKSDMVNDVLFPHAIHTYWLDCKICHEKIFPKGKLPEMKMMDFIEGKWCGRCHNKVSFPLGDCLRCHTVPKQKIVETSK